MAPCLPGALGPPTPGRWASLALQPAWRFTDSSSNDAYYDYESHALELGLSLSY